MSLSNLGFFSNFQSKNVKRFGLLIGESVLPFALISNPQESAARESRNRKVIPLEDYLTTPNGLKYYDIDEGKGPTAEKGSTVQVHFDCVYNKITAVSSRESKNLAGNRTIAKVFFLCCGFDDFLLS
ncbi:hypothetical protein L1887_42923 [Cichorium endivia]|nr:hypothetical protein L1887_42923 [Cichorium endivia]